jgi:hypothetical protein
MKTIKKITSKAWLWIFFFVMLLFGGTLWAQAQKISPYLVGNNYWMPGTMITELMKPGGLVDQADIQTIRIGGFGPNGWTDAQHLEYIRRIKAMGALPIVQVRASYSEQQAKDFITLINKTNNLGVRVWSIGNEPDHPYGGSKSDAEIADYTKRIAAALKSVDPTITVIALEFSGYSNTRYGNLIGGANSVTGLVPGKDYYYVDVIGFHRYVITDISQLMGSINDLVGKITAANASRPEGKKLKWGMGEFNSHYNNDQTNDPNMKVWSFNNGQFHAELWGVGMEKSAFSLDSWSMIEGPDRSGTDLSLFDKDYKGRSTYWHSLMYGQNMKENYLTSTDNQTGVGVVAMGDASGAAVMIINKNGSGYTYTLRLDNGTLGTGGLQISVNAGINKTGITGTIGATTTQMLVFCPDGSLRKRYTYSKANCDVRAGATIEILKTTCDPPCNNTPTINSINDVNYDVNDGVQTVSLSGIGDGDGCTQVVSVSASSSNSAVVAVSGVTYTSCNSKGTIALTPNSKGTATVTVTVTDDGKPDCTPLSKSVSFTVNVTEAVNLPAKVEAEAYTAMFGIQTEPCSDEGGGLDVGYTDPGDYLDFYVNVPVTGTYNIDFRVASAVATGKLELRNEAGSTLAELTQGTTGGWQWWVTKTVTANLTAGKQMIKIYWTGAGLNLNWFQVKAPQILTSIIVSRPKDEITVGEPLQFTAIGLDQFEQQMPITPTWSFVPSTGATISNSGLFTASEAGNYTINALSGTIMGGVSVVVTPYIGLQIPGKIEAEEYTAMQGVVIVPIATGGNAVGYVDVNDWYDFDVNVEEAGKYKVTIRLASAIATGAFQIKNGATVLATVAVPNTGGWFTFTTLSRTFNLAKGAQTLRIAATGAGFNVDWFDYEIDRSIKIEAESYSSMFGIQTETTTDEGGGLNVGWTDPGDWMNYTVNVPTTGTYTVNFRVASLVTTGSIELRNSAGTALASLAQGSTGGWQTWVTRSVTANLTAGSQTLRIYYTGKGLNLNWFELVPPSLKSVEGVIEGQTVAERKQLQVYPNPASGMVTVEVGSSDFNVVEIHSLTGEVLVKQPIISSKIALNINSLNKGLYLISLKGRAKTITQKLIVN